MIVEIDGVNIVPYIAYQGLKWQRNDLDGENAGRMLDGVMRRNRVGTKIRMDITCRPLTSREARVVLKAVYPEYVTVRYEDPQEGIVTKKMYSNNIPASYMLKKSDGTEYWSGITFPLIEV